jgi:hypothetical protein
MICRAPAACSLGLALYYKAISCAGVCMAGWNASCMGFNLVRCQVAVEEDLE